MPQTVHIKGVGAVHFPDSFTPEQITQAIERDILPQRQTTAQQAQQQRADSIPAAARAGRGAQDVIDRTTQLLINAGEKTGLLNEGTADHATRAMTDEQRQYERDLAAGGHEGGDWWRTTGNIAMQAPLMLMPGGKGRLLSKVIAGAAQGGASGALQFDETNSLGGTARNTGLGAVTGAVANPASQWLLSTLGKGSQAVLGKLKGFVSRMGGNTSEAAIVQAVPELAQVPPSVRAQLIEEAKAQQFSTGSLDAEQVGRKANLMANDVTPLKSMVTRNPQDWAIERNLSKMTGPDPELAKIGGQLTDVYSGNDAALARRLDTFGGGGATQEGYGMRVMQSLDDLANASQKEVSELYKTVRETKGDALASDARKVFEVWDDLKDSPVADPITEALKRRLTRLGMIDETGKLTNKTLTVKEAEGLRQFINQQPNVFGKSQVIRAIDEDVLGGAGEDAFKTARSAASERFGMLNNPATQRAINAYGELTQGKTAQNFIKTQVIDGAEQDVKTLLNTLDKIPDAAKKAEAIDAIKGGVVNYLRVKSVNQNSNQFSGANLSKAIREIGDGKLKLILGADDFAKLKSLERASLDATYQPAHSAVNSSNTTPAGLSMIRGGRGLVGVNLPLYLNETAEGMAARSGYGQQLAEALLAKSEGKLPSLPRGARHIGEVLSKLAVPAGAVTLDQSLNQHRKPADNRAQQR